MNMTIEALGVIQEVVIDGELCRSDRSGEGTSAGHEQYHFRGQINLAGANEIPLVRPDATLLHHFLHLACIV